MENPDKTQNKILDTTTALKMIFQAHGIACATHEDWVLPGGNVPAVRAVWHPRSGFGQLDIQVLIKPGVIIEECFAGIGEWENGLHDALRNFLVNSLHVLLTAFWGVESGDNVTVETWEISGKSYRAYIGNIGTRASEGVYVPIPDNFLSEAEAVVKLEPLQSDTHWVRTFFSNINGEQTFEALIDNKYWENGMDCLKNIPWTKREGYYTIRHFLVLRAI
jgi:Family of unknown function (DUF6348)